MCSTSSGCNWWRRLASVVAGLLLTAAAVCAQTPGEARGGDIEQAWARLAQSLDNQKLDTLKEHVDEILRLASNLGLARMTPLANALVVRARAMPPEAAATLLHHAVLLDPGSPEAWLALGALSFRQGAVGTGLGAMWHGVVALFTDQRLHHFAWPSLLLASLLALLVAGAVGALLGIRRGLALLWHDLTELGSQLRLGPNAFVLNLFIIGLPLFVGGDPLWEALWLFALCWAYLPAGGKAAGGVLLALVAAAPPLAEMAARSVTHQPNPILRATSALAEQRYDPQALEDLSGLGEVFGAEADYYRLLGDVYRQHGQIDAAAWSYREGLRLRPQDGPLSLSLGVVNYLDNDFNAALQAFHAARERGTNPVVSNYNLALTLAQTYLFPESEAAMAAARAADPALFSKLTRGRSHQLMLPSFDHADATNLLARKDPIVLLNQGLLPPPLARERSYTHPLAVGALFALLLAVGHYLLRRRHGLATACAKCGRPFCQRCKLSTESQTYCTQCVNIFLKKDMVAIETQMAKRSQLSRRQTLLSLESRIVDVLVPGLGLATHGVVWPSLLLVPLAVLGAAVGAVWAPLFAGPALMHTSAWALAVPGLALWAACVVAPQVLPRGRR